MPCDLCSFLRGNTEDSKKKKKKKRSKKKKKKKDSSDEDDDEEEEEKKKKAELPAHQSMEEAMAETEERGAEHFLHSHSHSHSQRRRRLTLKRSTSQAHREFLASTSIATASCCNIPTAQLPDFDLAMASFASAFPRFSDTSSLDLIRKRDYSYLQETPIFCLDYCGFGLFTGSQLLSHNEEEEEEDDDGSSSMSDRHGSGSESPASSSFALSEAFSANLWSHALFGCAPEGTMEWGLRIRIMEFLNIPESEYSIVFTATRGATFKLLADAYPWENCGRLATMYDYESESVVLLEHAAAQRNARVYRARFRWPSLVVHSSELKRELIIGSSSVKKKTLFKSKQLQNPSTSSPPLTPHQHHHHKPPQKKGLFVFPVQSRVSGSKYSYQWMSVAQQNDWHVLLDASSLGPKDMDSLGLSLFRPDFITASFYKLFGWDPSGFSCLIIKNTVAQSIQDSRGILVSGMVHVTPVSVLSHRDYDEDDEEDDDDEDDGDDRDSFFLDDSRLKPPIETKQAITSFSGPVPAINDLRVLTSPVEEIEYDSFGDDVEFGSVDSMSLTPDINTESNISISLAEVGPGSFITAHHPSANVDSASFSEDSANVPISPGNERSKDPHFHEGGIRSTPSRLSQKISGWTKKIKFNLRVNSNSIQQAGCVEGYAEEKCSVKIVEQVKSCVDLNDSTNQPNHQKAESFMESMHLDENLIISSNCNKPNVLSRETEGGFRLFGHRNIDPFSSSPGDLLAALNSSGSEDHENSLLGRSNEIMSEVGDCEPQLLCRGLDHADMVGLNKTSFRLRCLINWLISSLLKLQHPENESCLVEIYGPHVKYDRGVSVAFNVFDRHGKLHDPNQVRLLADQSNLSLGLGYLRNISVRGKPLKIRARTDASASLTSIPSRFEVVTATLGLMSNFQDVYSLWSFIARFLDPDFL